jgi:hypothetical protein
VTLRKGGIREQVFAVQGAAFWLFPTWEHQRPAEVKRAWHGELARSNRERIASGRIPIRCHCTVAAVWELRDRAPLDHLDGSHLWTPAYAAERLEWRPREPLTVLLLRAAALVEPFLLEPDEAYGGCRSWLDLADATDPADLIPSLTDDAFALHAAPVRAVLGAPVAEVVR